MVKPWGVECGKSAALALSRLLTPPDKEQTLHKSATRHGLTVASNSRPNRRCDVQ